MRYAIRDTTVTFYMDNPKRHVEATATQSFAGTRLTEKEIAPLVEGMVKKFRGRSFSTQRGSITHFMRAFIAYFRTKGVLWPQSSMDWQILVYGFFRFYLTDPVWSQARAAHRMRTWQTGIGGILEFLIEEEIIPCDVIVPKIDQRRISSIAKDQPLLGQARAKSGNLGTTPKKLLLDVSFGMTDADYLEQIEKRCRHLISVIQKTCLEHWEGFMQDAATGWRFAQQVSDVEIEEAITAKRFKTYSSTTRGTVLYASPAYSQGINWALAIVRYKMAREADIGCISIRALKNSPFFRNDAFGHKKDRFNVLNDFTAMTPGRWQRLQIPSQFYRFVGLISNIDAAAVCCLLTIEHPELTSESLQDAKLLNVRDKSYLWLTDSKDHSVLSFDKPRAGRRKSIVLTELSQKLIMDILQCTAPVRKVLRRAGDKTWRYLFLGVTRNNGASGFLGVVEGRPLYLTSGQGSIGLTTLYPELSRNGLNKGSFDYRRLRNTMGVIRWFETGSILEMSRRLGNTRRVALEHYLPPALLHAWNARIIRRFQNTLIVLAAHDEPYLLEVTDFSNIADLQYFIAQLILDYPAKTSPLADEIQRRLERDPPSASMSLNCENGLLNIRLSPKSLGLLYSYSNFVQRTLAENNLDKIDTLSGLAPRQFTTMASLLRHAAECEEIHISLRESLDVPLLKQIHQEALAMQVDFDAKLNQLSVRHDWANGL